MRKWSLAQVLKHFYVFFQGDKTQFLQKFFSEFLLVVENNNEEKGVSIKGARTGSFQLLGDVLTRYTKTAVKIIKDIKYIHQGL